MKEGRIDHSSFKKREREKLDKNIAWLSHSGQDKEVMFVWIGQVTEQCPEADQLAWQAAKHLHGEKKAFDTDNRTTE